MRNEAKFVETIRDCYLHQHIDEPTRRHGNDEPSLIDLVVIDEDMQVFDVTHHVPLGKSDHSVITFKFNCYLDYSKPKEQYMYENTDFEAMINHFAETGWEEEYIESGEDKTVEDFRGSLKFTLLGLRNQFVPKITTSGKPSWSEKGSFPVNKQLQEAIRQKHIQHRRWMSAKGRVDADAARLRYTGTRNKVKTITRQTKRKFEKDVTLKSKSNPKAFWSHIRRRLKTKTDRSSTKFSDSDKANILQNQFSRASTRGPEGEIPSLGNRTESDISYLNVTEEMVQYEIKKLNMNKSYGPDDIHPCLLIELFSKISKPIVFLLNKTIEYG